MIDIRSYNLNSKDTFPLPEQPYLSQTPRENTIRIQQALDEAEKQNIGTVYFPAGVYTIDQHLSLPNKVRMLGEGGTTFGTWTKDISTAAPGTFLQQAGTILKLADNSNDAMLIQKGDNKNNNWTDFYSAAIENFVFFGNKDNQTLGHGIYINDATDPTRGHCRFKNLLLLDIKQIGLYGGKDQNELYLDEVVAFRCGQDGIVINGQDCKLNRVQAALNPAGAGLRLTGGGALRLTDIDVWGNKVGVDISDIMNIYFTSLISNNNVVGVNIHAQDWSPNQIQILRGCFDANELCDIQLSPNKSGFGPFAVSINNCLFRGGPSSTLGAPKPVHAILDSSPYPGKNLVTDCFFQADRYSTKALTNLPLHIYSITNCFNPTEGTEVNG